MMKSQQRNCKELNLSWTERRDLKQQLVQRDEELTLHKEELTMLKNEIRELILVNESLTGGVESRRVFEYYRDQAAADVQHQLQAQTRQFEARLMTSKREMQEEFERQLAVQTSVLLQQLEKQQKTLQVYDCIHQK